MAQATGTNDHTGWSERLCPDSNQSLSSKMAPNTNSNTCPNISPNSILKTSSNSSPNLDPNPNPTDPAPDPDAPDPDDDANVNDNSDNNDGFWARDYAFIILGLLALFFGGLHIFKLFGGIFYYYFYYFPAAWGNDEMEDACFRILKEDGLLRHEEYIPFFNMGVWEWFHLNRCKGNRDGFAVQGRMFEWVWEWFMDRVVRRIVTAKAWPTLPIALVGGFWLYQNRWSIWFKLRSYADPHIPILQARLNWIFWGLSTVNLFWYPILSPPLLIIFLAIIAGGSWVSAWAFETEDIINEPFITTWDYIHDPFFEFLDFLYEKIKNLLKNTTVTKYFPTNCYHVSNCPCFDDANRDIHHLQRELNIATENALLAHHEKNQLRFQIDRAEEESKRYKTEAQKSPQYHFSPTSPRLGAWGSSPSPATTLQIEALEREITDLRSRHAREMNESKRLISQLQSNISYNQSAVDEGLFTVQQLNDSKAKIRTLEREQNTLLLQNLDLRGQLADEKANHSEKCQNEASCQLEIADLKQRCEILIGKHRELDNSVKNAAKVLRIVKQEELETLSVMQFLERITAKALKGLTLGDEYEGAERLLVQFLEEEVRRKEAYISRLERDVLFRGGDVKAVELGLDTTRPVALTVKAMTYEENASRVFGFYDRICDVLMRLENLYTVSNLPTPEWEAESGRDDLMYLAPNTWDEPKPVVVEMGEVPRVVQMGRYPTVDRHDELCERLVWAEMNRLYNRCLQLSLDIRRHAYSPSALLVDSSGNVNPIVARADILLRDSDAVLNEVLKEVLDCIPFLYWDSSQKMPDPRMGKKLELYNAMQISIVELVYVIRENQRDQPPWNPPPTYLLPNQGKNKRSTVEVLQANLMVRELSTLENRIIQLLAFMEMFRMPGTLTGPTLQRLQQNPSYEVLYGKTLVAKTWANLTAEHFKFYQSQKRVETVDERGRKTVVWLPRNNLLPLRWEEFVKVGLGLKDAVYRKELEEGEWPSEGLVTELSTDSLRGPFIVFKRTGGSNMNTYNNSGSGSNPWSNSQDNYSQNANQGNTYNNNSNSLKTPEHEQEVRKNTELRERIKQLRAFIYHYGIADGIAIPKLDTGLRKNAATAQVKSQNLEFQQQINMLTRQFTMYGKQVPKTIRKGGKRTP